MSGVIVFLTHAPEVCEKDNFPLISFPSQWKIQLISCQEASKFQNKISQYHINLISITTHEEYYKKSLISQFTASHCTFLSNCTNLLLHNNSVNQLAQAQSDIIPPCIKTEIYMYVPNIGVGSSKKVQI